MAEEIASPARRMLETQFSCVRFLSGVEDGRWNFSASRGRMPTSESPAETPIAGAIFSHDFHMECAGFPDLGQAGCKVTHGERNEAD
jgi:hypothetical protein